MFKCLDPVNSLGLDDKTTSSLISVAYNYYQTREINRSTFSKKEYAKLISCFVRFFGSLNSSKQQDEDLFQSYLKNEGLKGKAESIKVLNGYINEIKQLQTAKILFSSPDLGNTLNAIDKKTNTNTNKGTTYVSPEKNPVFQTEGEIIDEDGYLIQYLMQESSNQYVIGLHNRSSYQLKLCLVLEGLDILDNEYKGQAKPSFIIRQNEKKVFNVKIKSNYSGNVSFLFEYL